MDETGSTIRACPVCGRPVENSCYHDGEDVASVVMTVRAAYDLAVDAHAGAAAAAADLEGVLQELENCLGRVPARTVEQGR